jgi:hypothetical protein
MATGVIPAIRETVDSLSPAGMSGLGRLSVRSGGTGPGEGRWPGGQRPAADRSAFVRSVRSQEKSGSSRPKCPNAAVCA